MSKELYKKLGHDLIERQEERRKSLLKQQKEKRHLDQDKFRVLNEEEIPKKSHKRFKHFKELYNSEWSLQLSEWMRDNPDDLTEWLLVPCPRGQRCMVVAHNGYTAMFNKTGRRCFSFCSLLPGDRVHPNHFTVLDCIYDKSQDTFYVLDGLSYGNQELIQCDAKFRFFWLQSKFDEDIDLSQVNENNQKSFQLLRNYDFENGERIIEVLQRYPFWPDNTPQLDGFLFYHKEASYHFGSTPLVCWLFPFMIYDVLNLQINQQYEIPYDYENPYQYMEFFDNFIKEKKKCYRGGGNSLLPMDTDTGEPDEPDADTSLGHLLNQQKDLELEGMV